MSSKISQRLWGPGPRVRPRPERDSHLLESLDGGLAIIGLPLQIRCTDPDRPGPTPWKQLDDGMANTLVSVCGNSAFARANAALRIDKDRRWLT